MDEIDRKILKLLLDNAKINNVEMSKKINLTAPAVYQRIRRLQDSGIIRGYKAVLDNKKLGKGLCCFMAIKLTGEAPGVAANLVERQRQKFSEIEEIHLLTGRYDCLIKLNVRDVDDLREFMFTKLTKMEAFHNVETFIVLDSVANPNFNLVG